MTGNGMQETKEDSEAKDFLLCFHLIYCVCSILREERGRKPLFRVFPGPFTHGGTSARGQRVNGGGGDS